MKLLPLILMFATVLSAVLVHQTNGAPQQQQQQQQQQIQQYPAESSAPGNVPTPSYPVTSQGNQLPPAQYYYPTYPEYAKPGIAVQSGYEGYLIPTPPQSLQSPGILATLIPLSRYALSYGARAGTYLLSLLLILLVGGAFTTSICTFTPLCTITFLGLGLTKSQVKEQVTELARTYITPERVNVATDLVKRAIDKYAALQIQQRDKKQEAKKKEIDSNNDQ